MIKKTLDLIKLDKPAKICYSGLNINILDKLLVFYNYEIHRINFNNTSMFVIYIITDIETRHATIINGRSSFSSNYPRCNFKEVIEFINRYA